MNSALYWVRGYLCVRCCGCNLTNLVNKCCNSNIKLWNIKSKGCIMYLNILAKDYKKFSKIAKCLSIKIKISEKYGLMCIFSKYKGRWGIPIGMAIMFMICGFLSTYIWNIEIVGNENIDSQSIVENLEKVGFFAGCKNSSQNIKVLQSEVMLNMEDISWVAINLKGCNATVEVRETHQVPQTVDKDKNCNIVANSDGKIVKIETKFGVNKVEVGQIVAKGDLLVSGIYLTKNGKTMLYHSTSEILAETVLPIVESVPFSQEVKVPTGQKIYTTRLRIFGMEFPIGMNHSPKSDNYDRDMTTENIDLFGLKLPIEKISEVWNEYKIENQKYNMEEAMSMAEKKLDDRIKIDFKDKEYKLLEKEFYVENDTLCCKQNVWTIANICKEEEILTK